ncbi:hypothetical protein CDIK_1496 [Cucumispora dikerogammari]|nr:hypothetical protein CDIK_1496 [Cucumispora dikerogammari]
MRIKKNEKNKILALMPKVSKILNEIEKLRIISFLMLNTVPLGLTSIERLRFKKKARSFVFENGLLMIIKNSDKKNYICEHQTARMREACDLIHLPRHLERNAQEKL